MARQRIFAISALLVLLAASPLQAQGNLATLTIRVENMHSKGGTLRLGLYDAVNYPDDLKTTAEADVKAEAGHTIVTLHNVPPGAYAIEVFQDLNNNGKMDTSWIGLPLEPFGFSRDARPMLGKPRFPSVQFLVMPGENHQTLKLQNSG
jgi:uncharacterized protein (DUF2141 family)